MIFESLLNLTKREASNLYGMHDITSEIIPTIPNSKFSGLYVESNMHMEVTKSEKFKISILSDSKKDAKKISFSCILDDKNTMNIFIKLNNSAINIGKKFKVIIGIPNINNLKIKCKNGNVDLHYPKANEYEIYTDNGDVRLSTQDADNIKVSSSNGDIIVKTHKNNYYITASTKNGDIDVMKNNNRDSNKKISCTTKNGDILIL